MDNWSSHQAIALAKPEKPASIRGAAGRWPSLLPLPDGSCAPYRQSRTQRTAPALEDGPSAVSQAGETRMCTGFGLCPFFRELNAEVQDLRHFRCSDSGAATGAKWRWTRPPKVVGAAPGSSEASVKLRPQQSHRGAVSVRGRPVSKHSYWLSLALHPLRRDIVFLRVFFCHGEYSECNTEG